MILLPMQYDYETCSNGKIRKYAAKKINHF